MSVTVEKEGKVGRIQPYDMSGVFRGDDGILHYEGLHQSLVEMLKETTERVPDREAVTEIGGPSLTYREYFDRAMTPEAANRGRWRAGLGSIGEWRIERRYRRVLAELAREGNHAAPALLDAA